MKHRENELDRGYFVCILPLSFFLPIRCWTDGRHVFFVSTYTSSVSERKRFYRMFSLIDGSSGAENGLFLACHKKRIFPVEKIHRVEGFFVRLCFIPNIYWKTFTLSRRYL